MRGHSRWRIGPRHRLVGVRRSAVIAGAGAGATLSDMRLHLVLTLVVLIVIAHIFLWRSDMPGHLKLTFTILNAIGWTIVLAPILLIDRWLDAIKSRNVDKKDDL